MLNALSVLASTIIKSWSDNAKQKSLNKSMERGAQYRLQQARVESQIKRLESGDDAAIGLDRLSFQHRGIKDDYLLLVTTAPMLLLFIAPMVELVLLDHTYKAGDLAIAVNKGFSALDAAPQWYLIALALVYVDTFGFRRILRSALEGKLGLWATKKKG